MQRVVWPASSGAHNEETLHQMGPFMHHVVHSPSASRLEHDGPTFITRASRTHLVTLDQMQRNNRTGRSSFQRAPGAVSTLTNLLV